MTSLDTASALYEDIVEDNVQSSSSLASQLEQNALDEEAEVAAHLDEAAKDIRSSIGSAMTMKELPGGVAGQAQLGTDNVWIDSNSIRASDGNSIIDTTVASDIADHEEEHTRQSAEANQEGVEINGQQFDAREVREAAAISVQKETDFLSAEYKKITAALPMNEADRALVREGDFAELERKKNRSASPTLAA
ncbi:hypothetical protein HN801_02085 [Candidatus Peregrinibacteria bacterium]|nr:hypothetical protein [Candidatus Peregrinibacteria bacterium]